MAAAKGLKISKEQLETMYQTMTMRQIADHFGCGETAIWMRIKQHGIKLQGYEDSPRKRPKKFSESHLEAIRAAHKAARGKRTGPASPAWKGGLTAVNYRVRASGAYREWKQAVLALHGNKCKECGIEKGHVCDCCGQKVVLHVHHIEPFATNIERRFDPTNGEVLCVRCHRSRHD